MRRVEVHVTSARMELLPNIGATASETSLQPSLAVDGLQANTFGGVPIQTVVGPYNYFDVRARVTQTILDLTAWRNYRPAEEIARADEHVMNDARNLAVLALAASYLQLSAANERVTPEPPQLHPATRPLRPTCQH